MDPARFETAKAYLCHSKEHVSMFRSALLLQTRTDVQFACGPEGDVVNAHKAILQISSEYFDKMFSGPWLESVAQKPIAMEETKEVLIRVFLYMYTGEVHVSAETALPMLNAAKKYSLHDMNTAVSAYLREALSAENAAIIYHHASFYGVDDLARDSYTLICEATRTALAEDRSCHLSAEEMQRIVQENALSVNEAC
jgi:hypothetical protein